jgi:hypothetical protein
MCLRTEGKKIVAIINTLRWFNLKVEQIDDPYILDSGSAGGYKDGLILRAAAKIMKEVEQ